MKVINAALILLLCCGDYVLIVQKLKYYLVSILLSNYSNNFAIFGEGGDEGGGAVLSYKSCATSLVGAAD